MFDSFSNRVGASQAGRFAEGFDFTNPLNGADNGGVVVNEGGGGEASSFGAIASYQVCACCARFHGATSDGNGGGSMDAILNSDDRGGYGSNGKPSLSPGDAGTQITRSNTSWSTGLGQAATVTYAFRLSAANMPSDTDGFSQFSVAQINAAIQSFAAWSDVANITFTRVTDPGSQYSNNATILLGNYSSGQAGAAAFAYLPGGMPGATGASQLQGDVWVNSTLSYNAAPSLYNYGTQTLLHEIGHAIGLSHPADYNASAGQNITYENHATYFEDSRQYTVMSYFSESKTGADFGGRYASAPLMDDIAAAQRLYGVNTTTRTGNNTYGFNSNAGQPWFSATGSSSPLIFCVWDAGGTDTFDFSGYTQAQVIDLRQGAFSNVGGLIGNVSIAIGAVIENVIGGTGADTIRGNSGANIIRGGGGADVIDGGLGSDTVVFSGARADYTITWNGQVGTVSATGQASVTITNVEFLQFSDQTIAAAPTGGLFVGGDITNETITGSALGDTLGGLGGNDTINGLNGDDYLDGGSGIDVLNGGDGNDILVGGLGNDTLNGGAGIDTADYSGAASGITADLMQGLSGGGGGADILNSIENITGTIYADTITGDAANNVIRGGGGVDTLSGGGGDDQLFAGAPGESGGAPDVLKGAGTANGTRATAVSLTGTFDLMAKPGVVNATTTPHSTVVATTHGGVEYYAFTVTASNTAVIIDIDGATFDTTLRLFDADGFELASNDDGNGDPEGGPSGDSTDSRLSYNFVSPGTYYIQVAEWVSNSPGGVFNSGAPASGETYTMHVSLPGQTVQPITQSGSTLNGDAGADILTGGSGKDTLNGGADNDTLTGGAENDTLNGGDGTDTAVYFGLRSAYSITTSGGVTTITGPDGTDTVTNVERLQFSNGLFDIAGNPIQTSVIDGSANADTLTGTANADTINGLGGDDTISGLAGNDTINGGDGVDTAVFSGTMAQSTVVTNAGTTTVTGPDGTDTLTNVEYLRFSDGTLIVGAGGGQLFTGTANAETLTGTAFNDQINAAGGADTINGAAGNDTINAGDGDDVITGGQGNDAIDGGQGFDTAVFDGNRDAYSLQTTGGVTTITGPSGTDTLVNVERLQFANGYFDISGAPITTTVNGTAGADNLQGTFGFDVINGAGGNDTIQGGTGNDTIDGGDGLDTAVFNGNRAAYAVSTVNGITTVTGADGVDTLTNVEQLQFSDGLYRSLDGELVGSPSLIFGTVNLTYSGFGTSTSAGGWTSQDAYPRLFADMNGDGMTDVAGFGAAGLYVALANGVGGFGAQTYVLNTYGYDPSAGGWTSNELFPRTFADVNGDGHADVIGFGDEWVQVALANGAGGFLAPMTVLNEYGQGIPGAGWGTQLTTPRMAADVNGDGLDDLVGFRGDGVVVALATGGGHFADAQLVSRSFGADVSAGGWTETNRFPRIMADVNGDGMADIVGFGDDGVLVSLATGNGSFGSAFWASSQFGASVVGGGWISNGIYPRTAADVNGDGRADLIGFGDERVYIAYANADGTFSSSTADVRFFARSETSGGFASANENPRGIGDFNGDGYADLIGVNDAGLYVALGGPGGFSAPQSAPQDVETPLTQPMLPAGTEKFDPMDDDAFVLPALPSDSDQWTHLGEPQVLPGLEGGVKAFDDQPLVLPAGDAGGTFGDWLLPTEEGVSGRVFNHDARGNADLHLHLVDEWLI